jgi:hypothetical protein
MNHAIEFSATSIKKNLVGSSATCIIITHTSTNNRISAFFQAAYIPAILAPFLIVSWWHGA